LCVTQNQLDTTWAAIVTASGSARGRAERFYSGVSKNAQRSAVQTLMAFNLSALNTISHWNVALLHPR
jgi:hypothetical protein